MSACISSHGEFSEHTISSTDPRDPDSFLCDWCGALDENTLRRRLIKAETPTPEPVDVGTREASAEWGALAHLSAEDWKAILASDWLAAREADAEKRGEERVANAFVAWAIKNETAEPPLDWAWFGEIARQYSPLHEHYRADREAQR